VQWYNDVHRHSSIKFVTPNQRHNGCDVQILADRDAFYQRAREENPARWSGSTRNWQRDNVTVFNADKKSAQSTDQVREVA